MAGSSRLGAIFAADCVRTASMVVYAALVQVQQRVPIHGTASSPPIQLSNFRIGINIGDAIADGTDKHGDAVNVAARIQAECPPGGVCVTRTVRDYMRGRLKSRLRSDWGAQPQATLHIQLRHLCRRLDAVMTTPRPSRVFRGAGV